MKKEKDLIISIYDDDIGDDNLLCSTTLNIENMEKQWMDMDGACQILLTVTVEDYDEEDNEVEKTTLKFTIVKGRDLEKSDYIGKSDPYVVATYKNKVFQSKTINNNQNPNWNFTVIVDVEPKDPGYMIVEIFDEDYDADDKIGEASLNVQELIDCVDIENQWMKLKNCSSGEIQFSSKVTQKTVKTERIYHEATLIETLTSKTEQNPMMIEQNPVPRTPEFDKLHKKSCKRVIRRTEADGTVVEEIIEDNDQINNKKSIIHIPSGFEVDSLPIANEKDLEKELIDEITTEKYCSPSIQSSVVSEFKIHKISDSSNPIEDLDRFKKTSVTTVSSEINVENIEFVPGEDEKLLQNLKELQASTKSKITGLVETVQLTKNVDTTDFVSQRIVKTVDRDGNVTEEIFLGRSEPDAPTSIEHSHLPSIEYPHLPIPRNLPSRVYPSESKRHSFIQYFTSSNQPFETIQSFRSHYVDSFPNKDSSQSQPSDSEVTEVISRTESNNAFPKSSTFSSGVNISSKSVHMFASGESSLEDLKTNSSLDSWLDHQSYGHAINEREFIQYSESSTSSETFPKHENSSTDMMVTMTQVLPAQVSNDNFQSYIPSFQGSPNRINLVSEGNQGK